MLKLQGKQVMKHEKSLGKFGNTSFGFSFRSSSLKKDILSSALEASSTSNAMDDYTEDVRSG